MPFEAVNSKVVRAHVSPQTPVLARRGAMLGYSGQVTFRPVAGQGRGVTGLVGAALSGESNAMMATEGSGEVLYGYKGLHTTVLELDGAAPLVCEADRLLAHDAQLQTSVQFIGSGGVRQAVSGAMTGQGLFTTNVHGRGAVALLSEGPIIALEVGPGADVVVDPDAYVGSYGQLQMSLVSGVSWKSLVGEGTGEPFSLRFAGSGVVYIQSAER